MKTCCAVCKGYIAGRKGRGSKTAKATSRKMAALCGSCLRTVSVEAVRVKEGFKSLEQTSLAYRPYIARCG